MYEQKYHDGLAGCDCGKHEYSCEVQHRLSLLARIEKAVDDETLGDHEHESVHEKSGHVQPLDILLYFKGFVLVLVLQTSQGVGQKESRYQKKARRDELEN